MARLPPARPERLARYHAKRDFARTSEPHGEVAVTVGRRFVVQKHAARRLHYDFRLEIDGVLVSWAVTKGPSYDPTDKRLAVRTEDHPLNYATFEGTIPAGEYGGGTVMLWDQGTWRPLHDARAGLVAGKLHFLLDGTRLKGEWVLVRMKKDRAGKARENWLLMKGADGFAGADLDSDDRSVATGRRLEEIAHSAAVTGEAVSAARARTRSRRPVPDFVEPQLATLTAEVPVGDSWLFELKHDGYRAQLALGAGEARIYTRSGLDWSERFPELITAGLALGLDGALIDGEIVAVNADGRSEFGLLQQALDRGEIPLSMIAFDLLALRGEDLRDQPLLERKRWLADALGERGRKGPILFGEHFRGDGAALLAETARLGMEGIIAKQVTAPYQSGRGPDWLKVKTSARQEFVIVGMTPSGVRGRPFASLLLAISGDGGKLRYAGRVGTGFTGPTLADLASRLHSRNIGTQPVEGVPVAIARNARWVEPEQVAEIRYAGRTGDGLLRHAVFVGLREDKAVAEVSEDEVATVDAVRLTHPEKLLFPKPGITKKKLADYYHSVAGLLLPHLAGRPVSLLRCPDGVEATCFFQRHPAQGLSNAIGHITVVEADGGEAEYLRIDDVEGLLAAVQVGTLELHVWGARADTIERPERLVFDLDPDAGLQFGAVRDAAFEIKALLEELGLTSYPLLTGGKGIHVVAPIAPDWDWPVVEAFAKGTAERLTDRAPDRYTTNLRKAARDGRIFIDWLRNQRGSTAIVPWSTRAKPNASVAAPISWDELRRARRADSVTIKSAHRRFDDNPWAGYFELRQSLTREAATILDTDD